MTAPMLAALDEQSAVATYIAAQRRREATHMVREILRRAWNTDLSHAQAARVLNAAGVGITEQEVEWAVAWLDILENPKGYAEAEADDQGWTGSLYEAQDRFASVAQTDLDTLVERLVRAAAGVSVEVAVLAVVYALVGE